MEKTRDERSAARRWLRPAAIAIGGLLGVALLLVAAALAFLSTEAGRATLASLIEDAASGPDSRLEIGALEGGLFSAFTLRGVTLADAGGTWLELDAVSLAWSPAALLGGRLQVERLTATRIALLRPPQGGGEEEAPQSAAPGSLDPLPLDLALEELRVDEVVLGKALLGAEARLSVKGRLSATRPEGISTELRIARTDGEAGHIDLDALFRPQARSLDLSLSAEEPAGGLIARLAGIPDLPPVSVSFQGQGPIGTWRGKLNAEAGDAGSLDAEIALSSLEPLDLRLTGEARPGGILSAELRPLLAPATRFEVAARLTDGEALELSSLDLEAPAGRITGSGRLDLDSGALAMELNAAPRLEKLAEALALPLSARSLTLDLAAAGTLDRPEARLTLAGDEVVYQQARMRALNGRIGLAAGKDGAWSIEGSGRFEGLEAARLQGAESVTESIDWSLQAELGADFERISGVELALYGGGIEVSAEGAADLAALTGDGSVNLKVAELSVLSGLAGTPLAGSLEADALLASDGSGGATATLGATLTGFDAAGLELPAALGESLDLYAEAESAAGGAVTLHALELGGDSFQFTASGMADPEAGSVSGHYSLEARDLSRFTQLAGSELAGSGSVAGDVSGSLESPRVTAEIAASEFAVAGQSFPEVSASLAGENLAAAPSGSAEFQARTPYGAVSGRAAAAVEGETLKITEFALQTPQGEALRAEISLPMAGGPAEGRVTGRFPSLALASTLSGMPLRGSGEFTLDFGGEEGAQALRLNGGFRDLLLDQGDGDPLRIQAIDLSARARLGEADTQIEASADLRGVAAPGATLESARLTAEGALSALSVGAEGRGALADGGEPLAFSTAAQLDLSGAPSGRVERLEASVGERQARLNAPVDFAVSDGGGFSLSRLDLAVGEGRLSGSAEIGKSVDANLMLSDLPLAFLQPLLPGPAMEGSLSAELSLSGSAAAPRGSYRIALDGFRVERRFSSQLTPLALAVNGQLGAGRLTAEGTLTGLSDGADARLTAELPLELSLAPFAAALPESAPISAALRWQGEVTPLMARLPVDDHRLEGQADIDLRVAGSLAQPELRGGLVLSEATYENFVSGTLLEDLELELAAEGDRLAIRRLSAEDGSGGGISASGAFAVSEAADSEVSATLAFDQATLLRRDDLEATVSGDFSVEGDLGRLVLTGDLTGDKIEVRLIDNLPPSVTELQVTEINSDDPAAAEPEEEEQVSTPMEIALDLSVTLPGRVFIRGRGLDSEWEGEFQVEGTAENPSVRGQLRPVRGNFSFAGKTFELQQGSVTLTGGTDLNPELDLAAVYLASNIEAKVRVFGRADDPQFELSSTPALPQEEIVSRILFERGTAQLSAAEALQLSSTIASLTGAGGPGIMDRARQGLGLDVLSFGAGAEGSLGAVEAGKYIADGVFVGVRQGATPQSTTAVVEVELTDNITVESTNEAAGSSSVGVRWEWDY